MFGRTISKREGLNEPLLEENSSVHPADSDDYQFEGAGRYD